MQLEVVLCLEGLLADLTLEPPSNAVGGEVASEVPFTRENLTGTRKTDQMLRRGLKMSHGKKTKALKLSLYLACVHISVSGTF